MQLVDNLHEKNLGVELFGPEKAGHGAASKHICCKLIRKKPHAILILILIMIMIIHHLASQ